jgi:ketopantoate reductase
MVVKKIYDNKKFKRELMAIHKSECCICGLKVGENDIPDSYFHFHHPGEKRLSIGSHRGKKEEIIEEVKKRTILCCCECHLKLHEKDGEQYWEKNICAH